MKVAPVLAAAAAMMASVAVAAPAVDATVVGPRDDAETQVDALVAKIKADFQDELESKAVKMRTRGQTPKCTPDKVVFRRE